MSYAAFHKELGRLLEGLEELTKDSPDDGAGVPYISSVDIWYEGEKIGQMVDQGGFFLWEPDDG